MRSLLRSLDTLASIYHISPQNLTGVTNRQYPSLSPSTESRQLPWFPTIFKPQRSLPPIFFLRQVLKSRGDLISGLILRTTALPSGCFPPKSLLCSSLVYHIPMKSMLQTRIEQAWAPSYVEKQCHLNAVY